MTQNGTPFSGRARWIWAEGADFPEPGSVAVTARFKRGFSARAGCRLTVHVSADSHYLLWLNGRLVGRGPAKGDPKHWPYETHVLDELLVPGPNELTALAVCFAPSWPDYERGGAPVSVMSAAPGFILDGQLLDGSGNAIDELATDRRWQAAACRNRRFVGRPGISCAGPGEETEAGLDEWDDATFGPALELARGERPDTVYDSPRPHRLIPRRIPFLEERPGHFKSAWDESGFSRSGADAKLLAGEWVEVEPHGCARLLLDAGAITSGYPLLEMDGPGTVRLAYGERLTAGRKIIRNPALPHEVLTGPMFDIVRTQGKGAWEPVFWRAFRFLQLNIEAGAAPFKLRLPEYTFTAYPYHELPKFTSSDPEQRLMDEVSWRTLRMCSHETFEDCPTRERLQYAGDVHVQARTAYWMAGDTALARQAMLHFADSVNDEGLTASRYPSRIPQLIPLWSLHWVMSVGEYYHYTADTDTVGACFPAISRTLDWFLKRRETHGLVGWLPYWKIADWCKQWDGGTPPGMECGPTALVNFMLVAALRTASQLSERFGDASEARERGGQAKALAQVSDAAFWDEKAGLYRDRPAEPSEYSQLTNAWAILSGVASPERARRMAEPMAMRSGLCEAAWFGKTFLFDAYRLAGREDLAEQLLKPFRGLLPLGLTAWPESPELNGCSECHGWSNLPGLAFRQLYLGVRVEEPGCRRVTIAPWPGTLQFAEGVVPLPQGSLKIAWHRDDDTFKATVVVPSGVEAILETPDGKTWKLAPGPNRISQPLCGEETMSPMGKDTMKCREFTGKGGFGGWTPRFDVEEKDGIIWILDGERRIALLHKEYCQIDFFEFFPGSPLHCGCVEIPNVYHAPTLLGVKLQTCQWINWAQSRTSDTLDMSVKAFSDHVEIIVDEEWRAWKGRSRKLFRLRVDSDLGYVVDFENEMEGAESVKVEFANLLAKGMADHRPGKVRFPYVAWRHPSKGILKWTSNMPAVRTFGQLDTYDCRKIDRQGGWIGFLGEQDWNPVLTVDESSQDVSSITCCCLLDEHVHFKGEPARTASGGYLWKNKGRLFAVTGKESERLLAAATFNDLDTQQPHPERSGANWGAEYPVNPSAPRDPQLHALKLGEICDFENPIDIHGYFRGQFFPADEEVDSWAMVTSEKARSGSKSLRMKISRPDGAKTLGMCGGSLWLDGGRDYRLSLWVSYKGSCPASFSVRASQIYFSMANLLEQKETTFHAATDDMTWHLLELTLSARPDDPALVLELIVSGDGTWFVDDIGVFEIGRTGNLKTISNVSE